MFRPDPNVIGDTAFNRQVWDLLHVAPELRGKIRTFQQAPNSAVNRLYSLLGVDPNIAAEQGTGGLLGQWDDENKSVYIRPRMQGDDEFRPQTLAHESAHARGYSHESGVPRLMARLGAKSTNTPYLEDINENVPDLPLAEGPTRRPDINLPYEGGLKRTGTEAGEPVYTLPLPSLRARRR